MKNLFKVLFAVAAATTLFVACNKEVEIEINPAVRTVEFSAGPVTKTVFGTLSGTSLPTLWTESKTVGISLNLSSSAMIQSTAPVVVSDGATATFQAEISDSGSAPYTFYAVSPYSSVVSVSGSYGSVQVNIPASQTPLANSVDEDAQILVAKYAAGSSFPGSVALDFDHITAYGKISFSNLSLASGESIESVSLTAAENWVGRYYYYVEDHDPYSVGDIAENSAGKTLTLATTSDTDIWFACAPVDLGGKNVKVVITTDKGTYTKNVTIPAGKTFAAGKVNAFTINMSGITADGAVDYERVTNAADLTVGSQVIIAAIDDVAMAMSTTQNGNNRGATSVTKSQNNTVISSPSDAVQIFTIEAGNKANTIAFSTGSGYIYAANSSSNYLRTETTLSDNSSWKVTINSSTGEATLLAQGTNTRNYIRYNPNSGNPIFSCYASGSTTGSAVAIYKLADNTTWNLSSIEVTTAPYKTTYEAGEDFDATGMVVTAHYVDDADNTHTKNVVLNNADLTISPSTSLTAGTTSVSISYGGQSTSQAITVTAPITWDLKSIAVTTAPTKTTYTAGEYFAPAGMVVTATFENHDNTAQTKQQVVDNANLTFTPSTSTALTTDNSSVSISYTVSGITKSTTQAITVNAASVATEKEYYKLNTTSTPVGTSNSYAAYTDIACANNLASYGTYPSTATWSTTLGSKQSNTSFWWGSNSKQSAKMILSNGSVAGASAIATALGVTTSATYYSALICSTSFANISKVVMTRSGTGGSAPSNIYLLYSTDSGTTYTLADTQSDGATVTFTIASPVASARYALVIKCSGYCQYKDPIITFYTTD